MDIAGIINELISAGKIIQRMVEGCKAVLAKLGEQYGEVMFPPSQILGVQAATSCNSNLQ